jgi:translation initiation factor IF-1
MARTDAFQVEGIVIEALANGTYRLELANGHRMLGFVTGRAREPRTGLVAGETVRLHVTPYDLSSGRILVDTK